MFPKLQWNWVQPPGSPFKHNDYFSVTLEKTATQRFGFFGARVRGLSHKHAGLNCDDWFDFASAGDWNIIAVSDGAGSAILSRLGAKTACEASIRYLSDVLSKYTDVDAVLEYSIQEEIKTTLCQAFRESFHQVNAKADQLNKDEAINATVGRCVTASDLACTLNLVLHKDLGERSIVFGCQIGDGMIGTLAADGTCQVLSKPDSGNYAGETLFLTSIENMPNAELLSRVTITHDSIEAILVMTDGVANDFFPEKDSPLRIWCELLVNGIPAGRQDERTKMSGENLSDSDFESSYTGENEIVEERSPRTKVRLRFASKYLQKIGQSEKELMLNSHLAWQAHKGDIICGFPESQNKFEGDRLRLWLESFYIKGGSKDDRTLVVLNRKDLSPACGSNEESSVCVSNEELIDENQSNIIDKELTYESKNSSSKLSLWGPINRFIRIFRNIEDN